jgi:predicted MFS family arabinose efflux permease
MHAKQQPPAPPHAAGRERSETGGLAAFIAATIVCRIALNTARRFIYPFAPDLSRVLGVPLSAVTGLIAVNWATNLLGLFSGPIADRFGYRPMMAAGMLMLAAGMALGGAHPAYGTLLAAAALAGLGKSIFDPALQADIGERVPYRRRGLVVGFLETAWAGSTLIGIPAMALLIDRAGWRAAFFALGAFGLLGLVMLAAAAPARRRGAGAAGTALDLRQSFRAVARSRAALGLVLYAFFFNVAMDNLFVVYGVWLETAFGLSLLAVGLGTGVIGAAELAGEFLTAALGDRIGLKRTAVAGVALCILTYAALPFAARSAALALAGLFVHFCFFEMTIVTVLSFSTELLPGQRATMVAAYYASAGLGRVGGALLGGAVWAAGGIVLTCLASAGITAAALAFLLWGLRGSGGAERSP